MESRRLLLDVMLGKLATYLRLCGHDAVYGLDRDIEADDRLLAVAREQERTLLTRDRDLAARASGGLLLKSRDVREQLRELDDAGIALEPTETPTRCGRCNGSLTRVPTDEETPEYAPDPAEVRVWACEDCGQHFWNGSHWADMTTTLSEL